MSVSLGFVCNRRYFSTKLEVVSEAHKSEFLQSANLQWNATLHIVVAQIQVSEVGHISYFRRNGA